MIFRPTLFNDSVRIYKILRVCHGHEQAISARDIARKLGWPITKERTVRRIIAAHRHDWQEFIVRSSTGYFVATDYEEVLAHIERLANHTKQQAAVLKLDLQHARKCGFHIKL